MYCSSETMNTSLNKLACYVTELDKKSNKLCSYYCIKFVAILFMFFIMICYLIANPTSKFIMMTEHNRRNKTKATWIVGLPRSAPWGMNKSPKLNSPTIIAKMQQSDVNGSLKCSYFLKMFNDIIVAIPGYQWIVKMAFLHTLFRSSSFNSNKYK